MKFDIFSAIRNLHERCGDKTSLVITITPVSGVIKVEARKGDNCKYIRQSMRISKDLIDCEDEVGPAKLLNEEFQLLIQGLQDTMEKGT
ncbi:MAG: hypothetical protein JRJ45_00390 [Deltaproteobacteria bacterium]|nr:hypothetical protein [Deltaproteobacteria bacterium]